MRAQTNLGLLLGSLLPLNGNSLEDGRVVDAVEVPGDVVLADIEVLELRRLQGLPLVRMILPENLLDVEAVAEGALPAFEGVLLDAVQQLDLGSIFFIMSIDHLNGSNRVLNQKLAEFSCWSPSGKGM